MARSNVRFITSNGDHLPLGRAEAKQVTLQQQTPGVVAGKQAVPLLPAFRYEACTGGGIGPSARGLFPDASGTGWNPGDFASVGKLPFKQRSLQPLGERFGGKKVQNPIVAGRCQPISW